MKQIDNRYLRIKTLGSGTQGEVFLCMDPTLQRKVAVKLLKQPLTGVQDPEAQLHEARMAGGLNHPNIVSVFDAGQHDRYTYLVFEYAAGDTLAALMRKGRLPIARTLDILTGILSGLAYAHDQGLVHRDLKPANIVIADDDVPKIMDFGISQTISDSQPSGEPLTGTPRYMAPESVLDGVVQPASDVFAMGLIAYEMLTGGTAFKGADANRVLKQILDTELPAVSQYNADVDDKIEQWLKRATDKDAACRYASAAEMLEALLLARGKDDGAVVVDGSSGATVEFLMRRMQHKPEFPALARSVSRINQLVFTDNKDIEELSKIIVSDFGLTNKILKVVNSANYGPFAGKIGTISRAIIVLGTGVVRSIAATLSLLENLGDAGKQAAVRDELSASIFSGVFARELMAKTDPEHQEDALLAAMLHNLGRLLVAFYLPDEWSEVQRLISQNELESTQAETRVLGTRFDAIGRAAAARWNFPKPIVQTMQALDPGKLRRPADGDERLKLIANCANDVTAALVDAKDDRALRRVAERYGDALEVSKSTFDELIRTCEEEFIAFQTEAMPLRDKQKFVARMQNGQAQTGPVPGASQGADAAGADMAATTALDVDIALVQEDAEQLLSQTIQEATNLLVGDYSLPELFSVVLEGMYRSVRFDRAVLCLRDPRSQEVCGKMGYGNGAETLAKGFRFRMTKGQGVFDITLRKGADIYIEDSDKPGVEEYLPDWFRSLTAAKSFLVLPIIAQDRVLGMIYGEFTRSHGFVDGERLLNPLKSLRNQLILGIKAKM